MTVRHGWVIVPVAATLCTVLGVAAGWLAARGRSPTPGGASAAESHAEDEDLPPATLRNLGVTVARLQPTEFVWHVPVAGVLTSTATTEQPVFAPIGGRIQSIDVVRGAIVAPGETVVTLVRDPLPRPTLTLTAEALAPAQESLHQVVLTLRKSGEEVRIARTELERVEQFTGKVAGEELPIIPRQRAIDLRYELARAESAHEQAHLELRKHGLTEEQITSIETGAPLPPLDEDTWKRALARNGLWPATAESLSATLPPSLRSLPWVTATIGELAASGLATPELAAWLARDESAARHFLEFGVLLQRGHTLEDLQRLHGLNAFEPVARIDAPDLPGGGARWDVSEILVKRGAAVTAGTPLVTLRDPRRLYLRTEPVGSEVNAVLSAAGSGADIAASPLIRGAGPDLAGLRVGFVEDAPASGGTVVYLAVDNTVLHEVHRDDGLTSRIWALREGMQYILRVPAAKLENVFVLPATAVTDDGPNKIVFIQSDGHFQPIAVQLAHSDHERAVIPISSDVKLSPGDLVVQTGAFELALALRRTRVTDPHAGHQH